MARGTGDPWVLAMCLYMTYAARPRPDLDGPALRARVQEAIGLSAEAGEPYLRGLCVHGMGDMLMYRGEWGEASQWYRKSLPVAEGAGNTSLVINTLDELATCYRGLQDLGALEEVCRKGLDLCMQKGYRAYALGFLRHFGALAIVRGCPVLAARILGAARGLWLADPAHPKGGVAILAPQALAERYALDPDRTAEAWNEGVAMTLEDGAKLALSAVYREGETP
jgi:hypothetical protein